MWDRKWHDTIETCKMLECRCTDPPVLVHSPLPRLVRFCKIRNLTCLQVQTVVYLFENGICNHVVTLCKCMAFTIKSTIRVFKPQRQEDFRTKYVLSNILLCACSTCNDGDFSDREAASASCLIK